MRTFLSLAFALIAALGSAAAHAFPVPGKPVRVIVGWAAGGPTDIQARAISNELAKQLGVPVLVENKPGASGGIGAAEVARAVPDGHTLLYTVDGSVTQTPHLLKTLPFDPFKDLVAASRSTSGGVVLVAHPSVPATNLPELIAYARANPGKLSYSSFGTGTVSHIYGEVLAQIAGVPLVHVPYKGSSDAMKDLLTGRVQLMFDSPSIAGQYVATGQLRMIGSAGDKRRRTLPDVPTLLEQGVPGFEIRGWNGFFGPASMPPATLQAVNEALRRAQNTPAVTGTLLKMGFEPVDESAADTAKLWRSDYQRWGEYIRRAKIQME
jgi:tripartite-type tricarboxylate transporter receptor subunit TctC